MKHLREIQDKLGIIGRSKEINEIVELIATAAPTNITVLIIGETGTGKEVIAHSIHKLSDRKHQSFIAVNCGALPENLIDSELFGHEKGSFTGAIAQKKGLFEQADGGTIFLDELGEMPLLTQVRLLRVLESGQIIRVGGTEAIKVDVRIVAATHRNLYEMIDKGTFREDLYYRIKAITMNLPPLRERKEDIQILVDHFIKYFILHHHVIFGGLDDDARDLMTNYSWPGNVRELKNTIETLLVVSKGQKITSDLVLQHIRDLDQYVSYRNDYNKQLPVKLNKSSDEVERELIYQNLLALRMEVSEIKLLLNHLINPMALKALPAPLNPSISNFSPMKFEKNQMIHPPIDIDNDSNSLSMIEVEKETIKKALDQYHGNRRKAAQALNISERTLYRKIKEYYLE